MVEIHCFITLRDSFKPCDEENENYLPLIQKEIEKLEYYEIELKSKNGERYIEFSHFTNHLGTDFSELLEFFGNVGKIAEGSYGLFYMHNDEDQNEYNSFHVWRLAKGEVRKFKDRLLSPFVPTVEDFDDELNNITTDKNFIAKLERYTRYQNGDLSCECKLVVQDKVVYKFDFSKYDLGGSAFLSVTFKSCDFSGVYLSGSNFGGSIFNGCMLKDNTLRKAEWDNIQIINTSVKNLDAFRVDFLDSKITDSTFSDCTFVKGNFNSVEETKFKNVIFERCNFTLCSFDRVRFDNVLFKECTFENTTFDNPLNGVSFENCKI